MQPGPSVRQSEYKTVPILFFALLSVFLIISCNKNINASANKAYMCITNAAPGAPPIDAFFNGEKFTTAGQLAYCTTTGVPGDLYDTAVAGIHSFSIAAGTNTYANGNISLGLGKYYSVFVYDTLSGGSFRTLVLQDGIGATSADTLSAYRFLNLSPDTNRIAIILTNQVDTTTLAYGLTPFIGPNPVPGGFSPFSYSLVQGSYGVVAYLDSAHYMPLDSVSFTGGKTYTIYITGFYYASGANALGIHLIQHN